MSAGRTAWRQGISLWALFFLSVVAGFVGGALLIGVVTWVLEVIAHLGMLGQRPGLLVLAPLGAGL